MQLSEAMAKKWGTYGKHRQHSLRWTTLGECNNEHLQNIKRGGWGDASIKKAIDVILEHRLYIKWKFAIGDQVYHFDHKDSPDGPGIGTINYLLKYSDVEPDVLEHDPFCDSPAYLICWVNHYPTLHPDHPTWPAHSGLECEDALIRASELQAQEEPTIIDRFGNIIDPQESIFTSAEEIFETFDDSAGC